MAWPRFECRNGMASQISCESQWHGLTVSALMAWSHKYIFPAPQSIVLYTLTYLLPDSSDRRPQFSASIGGGGGGFESWPPRAPPPPSLFPYLPPEEPHRLPPNIVLLPWCYSPEFLGPCPPLLPQCPPWCPRSPPPSNVRFQDGSMASLDTLM